MLNSEHSIAWNTAYSITYEDYAKSEQNCMTRKPYAEKYKKQHRTSAQRAAQYNAKWNDFMQFSEENSMPNEIMLF